MGKGLGGGDIPKAERGTEQGVKTQMSLYSDFRDRLNGLQPATLFY